MLDQEFLQQVRDALHHLYDYPYLENHPLAWRFWPEMVQRGPSRAHRLSRLLLESIEALNPPGQAVADASRVRFYSLLVYRYVEERPLPEIMRALGYSRSQFFREQQRALTMLASVLQEKLAQQASIATGAGNLLDVEAERILTRHEAVNPAEIIRGVLEVIRHLAEQRGATLGYDLETGLPALHGSRTLLRQVFLKGLSVLLSWPAVRRVSVRMHREGQWMIAELIAVPGRADYRSDEAGDSPDLEPVRRLVKMMGGRWQGIEVNPEAYICRFDLPVESKKTLLVIEDNEGIIRVFQGHLADYGYLVIGATAAEEALKIARELAPVAITLDIMMPTQDGWEILQALKSDPATRSIPVIICSVLEDPGLALSLGAVAYLQKPVSQAALLETLNRL